MVQQERVGLQGVAQSWNPDTGESLPRSKRQIGQLRGTLEGGGRGGLLLLHTNWITCIPTHGVYVMPNVFTSSYILYSRVIFLLLRGATGLGGYRLGLE